MASERGFGLDLIRIYLGVALLVRGALFVADQSAFVQWMDRAGWFAPVALGHVVAFIHVGGGIFLALGLFTRLAAAAQLPPLFAAVFLIHWQEGLMQPGQSLELAGLVLALLIVFMIFGSGRFSLDGALGIGRAPNTQTANTPTASGGGPIDGPLQEHDAALGRRGPPHGEAAPR